MVEIMDALLRCWYWKQVKVIRLPIIFPKISKKSKKKHQQNEFRLNRNGTEKGMPRVTCKKLHCEQNDSKLIMRLVRRLISRISSHNYVVCSLVLVGFGKRHDTIFLSWTNESNVLEFSSCQCVQGIIDHTNLVSVNRLFL